MSQDISCLWLQWIVWIVLRAGQRCTNGTLESKNGFVSRLIHLKILIKDFFIKFTLPFVTWARLAKTILSSGDCDVHGPAVIELLPVCVFVCVCMFMTRVSSLACVFMCWCSPRGHIMVPQTAPAAFYTARRPQENTVPFVMRRQSIAVTLCHAPERNTSQSVLLWGAPTINQEYQMGRLFQVFSDTAQGKVSHINTPSD